MTVSTSCSPLVLAEWNEAQPPAMASVTQVNRWQADHQTSVQDHLVEEIPVALIYNGISHVVMLASPADLDDFAYGFSLTEGIITHANQIYGVELKTVSDDSGLKGIEVHIDLATAQFVALKQQRRNLVGRTGCGLCGAESLAQVFKAPLKQYANACAIQQQAMQQALRGLSAKQPLQGLTGASHACAWVSAQGEILLVREDVGRHNALDKLLGALCRQAQDTATLQTGWVLTTSRASYEMVQKIAMVGGRALVAMSAPTALAVSLAKQYQMTLVGFAKPTQCVVYHGQLI